ncbi:hypothetical protein B0H17DRAFT_1197708 [Mycena rosella]|uniref:Uncharacterized protein n=1 Tax=Mycena rosella TaxID=1033263 RepID=A0AAD7DSD1_MYCRO|nr:hypothetical protein B0H17DRAFT_1197708 [Mycena rosella]
MSAPTASASPPASPIKTEGSPTPASPLNSELGAPPAAGGPPKRKTMRCAKTAERMRRETLNGRFLTPQSSRRPSKAVIVSSRWVLRLVVRFDSVHGVGSGVGRASGRYGARMRAAGARAQWGCHPHVVRRCEQSRVVDFSTPLVLPVLRLPFPALPSLSFLLPHVPSTRVLSHRSVLHDVCAPALLIEVNEWRLHARILPLAMPPRSDTHAEVEDCDLVLEEGLDLEADAEDEDGEEDAPAHASSFSTHEFSPPRSAARTCAQQHQAPAAAAGGGALRLRGALIAKPRVAGVLVQRVERGPGGADFCVRVAAHAHVDGTAAADGDAGDAPVRPDADADARARRIGVRADPDERAGAGYDAPMHSGVGYDLDLDLDLGLGLGLGFPVSVSPAEEMMMMGMGGGGGWAGASSQHPAFQHAHSHHQHQQHQQQMQLRELQRQQAQMQQYLVQQQQEQRAEYEQQMGMGRVRASTEVTSIHDPHPIAPAYFESTSSFITACSPPLVSLRL